MSVEVPEVRALVPRPGAGLVAHRSGRWALATWSKLWERGARFETALALWYTLSFLSFGSFGIRLIWFGCAASWWGSRHFKLARLREQAEHDAWLEEVEARTRAELDARRSLNRQAVEARFEIARLEPWTRGPGTDQLTPERGE